MRKITNRQKQVLDIIAGYVKENGYAPSVRDIGAIARIASSSTVMGHLESLKKKGYVTWVPTQPRTLKILKNEETAS